MHQQGEVLNEGRDASRIDTSRQVGTRDENQQRQSIPTSDLARVRSLFIDGRRAHALLRLPVRPSDCGPASVLLSAYSPAGGLDDLAPREGDQVPFTFRLLSAAYLGTGGYHLDFSREGVLERALTLFLGPEAEGSARKDSLVVVRDHSFNIEDRIGLVCNARWSPADPEQGLAYPGIDAELHINWKLAEEVVRRLLHDPPLLDACSVSLGFGWEKSHPNLEDQQFWMHLGEELDGSPVRVVVTEILSVEHVGLVFAGADTSAKRTEPSAKRRATADPESAEATMTASLSNRPADKTSTKEGDPFMEKKTITITSDSPLLGLLGVEEPDLKLIEQRAGELQSLAELGREALADLRREVKALIVQLDGAVESQPSLGLLKVVQAADVATLKALKDEYARRLESLMPARCQVCGSEQVYRRSSRETSLTGDRRDGDDPGLYR